MVVEGWIYGWVAVSQRLPTRDWLAEHGWNTEYVAVAYRSKRTSGKWLPNLATIGVLHHEYMMDRPEWWAPIPPWPRQGEKGESCQRKAQPSEG